ncbi:MAG: hypothetical protein EOR57_31660 [Mesorhizobium sp.]|uniref:hypothetical protein n=1 Tax=Mesorhizobium sp. TaxID=1871066 RepID=UPI000FE9ADD2|nr:hypothetical protein [Mesorhizobium sp.]RWL14905.1 MAG: hypothetical protein EOR57_31660 [Mesorhizobium sp.]
MLELKSSGRYEVRGCDVRTVLSPFEMSRDHPEIIGQTIIIDGERMTVLAVERNLPSRPIGQGEIIGLIVAHHLD